MNPCIQAKLRVAALVTIFVPMLSMCAYGSDPSALEATLQSKYVGKVFTLRGFYADDHLHFDSNGNPLGNVHPGSWTTSFIAVKHIKVATEKVELKGLRLAELYDSKQLKFVPVRTKLDVTLILNRDAAAQADKAVLSAVDHLFLGANERLVDVAPDYWKAVLLGLWETVPQENGPDCRRIKGTLQRTVSGDIVMACEENAKTKSPSPPRTGVDVSSLPYSVGKKTPIVPPRVIFDPPLAYADVYPALECRGTVLLQLTVTPGGTPLGIAVAAPIGCGLDDQAVRAVETWKFKPAMLNGVPVPVQIIVEASFKPT